MPDSYGPPATGPVPSGPWVVGFISHTEAAQPLDLLEAGNAIDDRRNHSRFAHLRRRDRRAADRSDRSRLDAAQHHRFGEPLADISCTFGILVLRIADERADLPILTRMTNLKPSIPDRPALRKKGPFRNPLAVNESCAFKPAEHDPLEAAACVGSNGAAARSTPPNGNPHSRGSP